MATHYPIVFEREDSGVVSAYVAGLPVYAQGPTRGQAARVQELEDLTIVAAQERVVAMRR